MVTGPQAVKVGATLCLHCVHFMGFTMGMCRYSLPHAVKVGATLCPFHGYYHGELYVKPDLSYTSVSGSSNLLSLGVLTFGNLAHQLKCGGGGGQT